MQIQSSNGEELLMANNDQEAQQQILERLINEYFKILKALLNKDVIELDQLNQHGELFTIPDAETLPIKLLWQYKLSSIQAKAERYLDENHKNSFYTSLKKRTEDFISEQRRTAEETEQQMVWIKWRTENPLPVDKRFVNEIVGNIALDSNEKLLAGISIISKETHRHLSDKIKKKKENNQHDDQHDDFAIKALEQFVTKEELVSIDQIGVKTDVIEKAINKEVDLEALLSADLVNEKTTNLGSQILERFKKHLKHNICKDENGPYNLLVKLQKNQSDILYALISTICSTALCNSYMFYPLAVYVGLVIVKSGLDTYCKENLE